jgi:hypothetical protein
MNDEVQNEEVEAPDEIRIAFDNAVSGDKGEDEIKMALIGAGATFKNVTRLYSKYMVDAGYAVSKEEKAEIVGLILEGADVSEEEGFNNCVGQIMAKASGVTEKSAGSLIRAWAKSNEVEFYTKPKGAGGPRDSIRSRFFNALVANPLMTKDECTAHLQNDADSSNNVMNHESIFLGIRDLANKVYANATA